MRICARSFQALKLAVVILLGILPACTAAQPAAPAATTQAPAAAPAKVTEYVVSNITDISGPFAAVFKNNIVARKMIFAWWNDTRGKELGIALRAKWYDSRTDASMMASIWPGSLADNPIMALGSGTAEVAAVGQRAIADKVPLFTGGGGYSGTWKPDQWTFQMAGGYAHDFSGFFSWAATKEGRPIRFGQILQGASPSMYELSAAMKKAMDAGVFGGKVELVAEEIVAATMTDLASEVKRIVDKKPDYMIVLVAPAAVANAKRALESYKTNVRMVLGAWGSGLEPAAAQLGSLKDLEGDYEAGQFATALDTDIEAYKIYQQYNGRADIGSADWGNQTILGMITAVAGVRAVERAAKLVGSDKVNGQAVYDGMKGTTITGKEMLGLTADLTYRGDAAFPTKGLKMRPLVVKDGKLKLEADWQPIPEIPKW